MALKIRWPNRLWDASGEIDPIIDTIIQRNNQGSGFSISPDLQEDQNKTTTETIAKATMASRLLSSYNIYVQSNIPNFSGNSGAITESNSLIIVGGQNDTGNPVLYTSPISGTPSWTSRTLPDFTGLIGQSTLTDAASNGGTTIVVSKNRQAWRSTNGTTYTKLSIPLLPGEPDADLMNYLAVSYIELWNGNPAWVILGAIYSFGVNKIALFSSTDDGVTWSIFEEYQLPSANIQAYSGGMAYNFDSGSPIITIKVDNQILRLSEFSFENINGLTPTGVNFDSVFYLGENIWITTREISFDNALTWQPLRFTNSIQSTGYNGTHCLALTRLTSDAYLSLGFGEDFVSTPLGALIPPPSVFTNTGRIKWLRQKRAWVVTRGLGVDLFSASAALSQNFPYDFFSHIYNQYLDLV